MVLSNLKSSLPLHILESMPLNNLKNYKNELKIKYKILHSCICNLYIFVTKIFIYLPHLLGKL
jgi:hypothetical protein